AMNDAAAFFTHAGIATIPAFFLLVWSLRLRQPRLGGFGALAVVFSGAFGGIGFAGIAAVALWLLTLVETLRRIPPSLEADPALAKPNRARQALIAFAGALAGALAVFMAANYFRPRWSDPPFWPLIISFAIFA